MGVWGHTGLFSAVLAVLLTALLAWQRAAAPPRHPPLVRGKDNTVLFITHAESGQINIQLATAQALMEEYPDVKLHFASFPAAASQVSRVSSLGLAKTPEAQEIVFHEIQGPDRITAFLRRLDGGGQRSTDDCVSHPPRARGVRALAKQMEFAIMPWTGEEYLAIYNRVSEIVSQVDPAVAVVDNLFRPAIDVLRHQNRLHVLMSPNALAASASYGAGFWKYPALGTGFSFPVPWHQIPENLYVNMHLIYCMYFGPDAAAAKSYLRRNGLEPLRLWDRRTDIPIIYQSLPEASLLIEKVPPNVIAVGPMLLDSAPAIEQDAALVKWLDRLPTVVVNFGSLFKYEERRARMMASVIERVITSSNVQVLWKMAPHSDFGEEYALSLENYRKEERVIIMEWLPMDMLSLLGTGQVIAYVHHGGSNSYHEAIIAGIPQVVVPLWEDHYNFAQLAEDIGIGIYANRTTAPEWPVSGLTEAILRLVDGG